MDLTEENKSHIDNLTYRELLYKVRFAKIGDEWFQGDTGEYWLNRMNQLRSEPGGQERHVVASKSIGW